MHTPIKSVKLKTTVKKRFTPEARRKMILEEATSFFAEYGFGGSTRQLAEHLGVTQPLIYKYFSSKSDLINAVYKEVFEGRWNDDWSDILADRTKPLIDRLESFYASYCKVIYDPIWMRTYLFAGLRSLDINQKYNPLIEDLVIGKICRELRVHLGLQTHETNPITTAEFEAVWTMHGGIFYYGVRRYVYKVSVKSASDMMIRNAGLALMNGYDAVAREAGVTSK